MNQQLHVVMPAGVRDPARPSGGNVYDVRVCEGLAARGWPVREVEAPGGWPSPDPRHLARLAQLLSPVREGDVVLVDGLVGSTAPEVLEGLAVRARVLLLVHMPLLDRREARVVSAAHGFVVTSGWTRQRLLEVYRLAADVVHVALPGTDPAAVSPASVDGRRLLIVGPISRAKGHDVLMTALDALDEPWQLEVVGSRTVDPETASRLERWAVSRSVDITGPLRPAAVAAAYARADLLVHPSRAETYGMVVTEALARGIPVAASDVGGTREALGMGRSGLPGRLLAPADPPALAGVLRAWLSDAALRSQLRTAAAERRRSLPSWSATVDAVAAALRAPRLVGVPQ